MWGAATRIPPLACSLLVDGLNVISWALLASAGVTRQACALLAPLWTSEDGTTHWSG
jgi:hypothetical protein